MSTEQITAIILAVVTSNAATAVITSRQTRTKTAAEATQIISNTYDRLIDQLTHQLNDALVRINTLESNMTAAKHQEVTLSNRVALLERSLIQAGVDLPYE